MPKFIWYDLMTTDCNAAASFYENVVGWKTTESGMPDAEYTLFSMGSTMVAGLMPIPPERSSELRPCWNGYIGVEDTDAYAARVTAGGGTIHRPPEDITGVGRFAVVADPHGAVFLLFTPNREEAPSLPANAPGRIGWHELHAEDAQQDFAFYADLFGWTKADAIDMGPMGIYQLFAVDGDTIGGVMRRTPETPGPFWLYYFNVETLDGALSRVNEQGGTVLNGPAEVPGGSWIAQCNDPQGAVFALVAPKR